MHVVFRLCYAAQSSIFQLNHFLSMEQNTITTLFGHFLILKRSIRQVELNLALLILVTTPVFLKFKNTVISKNFGIFGCGINQNGQRKEHIMPVEGYMRFQIAESMGSFMAALCVSDGWYGTARYLNPNYARYTDTFGVFFSR